MPATGLAKGSCQSGSWTKQYKPVITIVTGAPAYGNDNPSGPYFSEIECPDGYNLTGGGYNLSGWNPNNGPTPPHNSNAPDDSMPYFNVTKGIYSGWYIHPGGMPGYSSFVPFAVCAK